MCPEHLGKRIPAYLSWGAQRSTALSSVGKDDLGKQKEDTSICDGSPTDGGSPNLLDVDVEVAESAEAVDLGKVGTFKYLQAMTSCRRQNFNRRSRINQRGLPLIHSSKAHCSPLIRGNVRDLQLRNSPLFSPLGEKLTKGLIYWRYINTRGKHRKGENFQTTSW
jgi:hypothetical protein